MPTHRPLSESERARIEMLAQKHGTTKVISWPPKSYLPPLLEAYDAGKKKVVLGVREFSIDRRYKGKFWLSPTGGEVAPCGWFDPDDIRKEIDVGEQAT